MESPANPGWFSDSNTRRRTQASQVAYYAARLHRDPESEQLSEDPKGETGGIVITNLSREAIYSVETYHLDRDDTSVVHVHYVADVLLPDKTICIDTQDYVTYGIDLKFRDNAGLSWVRTLRRGRGLFRKHGTPTVAGQHRRNRGRHYVTAPDLPTRDPTKRTVTLQSGTDWRPGIFRSKEMSFRDQGPGLACRTCSPGPRRTAEVLALIAAGKTSRPMAAPPPGSPFNEPGTNNPGGIGGQHYNETSQYEVARQAVSVGFDVENYDVFALFPLTLAFPTKEIAHDPVGALIGVSPRFRHGNRPPAFGCESR